MNILYYFEPFIELSRPHLRYHNLRYQLGPQIRALKNSNSDIKVKIALGEGTLHKCVTDHYDMEGCQHIVLQRNEIKEFYPNYIATANSLYNGDKKSSEAYSKYLAEKLDGFIPDVIISFLAPLPDFDAVWPNVVTLYAEFGIFSRAPYPRTFYFDPEGMFYNSSIRSHASELMSADASDDDLKLLTDFRSQYVFPFYKRHPILNNELVKAAANYEYKLLLPLQFSAYFGFDCCSTYVNQFEFLIDVMDSIPKNIGVFVTEHNGWPEVITEHNIKYLRDHYPNLLWSPHLSKIRSASQYLLSEVDGVVTVSSSVGLQCMMWDKPLFSPWKSHLSGFSQVNDLKQISIEKIKAYQPGTYDRAVLSMLTRYYMTEEFAYDATCFLGYLQQAISQRSATSFAERFAPFATTVNIFKSLRNAFRESDGHRLYLQDMGQELSQVVSPISKEVPDPFKKALNNIEVVSFDLFDTLVDRPFAAPHELFLFMQDQVRKIVGDQSFEFHKIRRFAEHRVRQRSERNEVTIEEIYDCLISFSNISESFKGALIELEFETELKFCRRRKVGSDLFEYALSQGKKIICISDFYFGQSYLKRLLDGLGYTNIDGIYVSADFFESKKEGTLFKKVIISSNLDPLKTLHVGDNHQSDIVNAGKFGFNTYFTLRAIERLKKQPIATPVWTNLLQRTVFPSDRAQLGQSIFFGLLAKKFCDQPCPQPRTSLGMGDPKHVGYVLLGPLLFAFSQWLIDRIKKKNIDKVFFLSRDGRLFNRAYDLFREIDYDLPPSKYLLSSRRAYGLASMLTIADAQDLIAIPFAPTELSNIFESRFSLQLNDDICPADLLDAANFPSVSVKVHPVNDIIRLKKLVVLLYPHIQKRAEVERSALQKYLDESGISTTSKPTVVDIGYAGTLQHYLTKLTGNGNISGHYFMTHAKAEEYMVMGLDIAGYFKENVEHHLKRELLSINVSLFELLFSSDESSLICFEESGEKGKVIASTKDYNSDPNRNRLVELIQRGALEFVEEALSYLGKGHEEIYFSRDFATLHLENLIRSPMRDDAILFNNIKSEDGFSARNSRRVVTDVLSALKKYKKLTKEQAQKLISDSEWQSGARAILPVAASKAAPSFKPAPKPIAKLASVPIMATSKKSSTEINSPTSSRFERHIKLYRKFKRDPYQYFSDSSIPMLRKFKRFFK